MTKDNLPLVSIIIVNHNGKQFLDDCFVSLLNQSYPKDKIEIIMVDNCSIDGSAEFVKEKYPQIKVIKSDVNNYCRANNLGIDQAKGEFVALLNNDTQVDDDWLVALAKVMLNDIKVGMAGSKILLTDGRIQNAGHTALPNFYWAERGYGEEVNKYDRLEEVSSLCGAAVIFRKEIFTQVGVLDEDFVMYFEDVDIAHRIRKAGWKVVFVPDSTVRHLFHGTSSHELSQLYIERNRLFFIAKHFPDKLSQAIFGKGYFTARRYIEDTGKIYTLLPEIIFKLIENKNIADIRNVMHDIFIETKKISNYENKYLVEEVLAKTKSLQDKDSELSNINVNFIKAQAELRELSFMLQSKEKEVGSLKDAFLDAQSSLGQVTKELDGTRVNFIKAQDELKEKNKVFNDLSFALQSKEKEVGSLKDAFLDAQSSLGQVAKELESMKANFLKTQETLRKKTLELDGIYNSDGFKLILRPLWSLIWNMREKLINPFMRQCVKFLYLLIAVAIFFSSVFLALIFLSEGLLWLFSKRLIRKECYPDKKEELGELKFSIVIPTYNKASYLGECLSSLYKTKEFIRSNNEIIVVDDGSSDGTVEYLRSNFPAVKIILNESNLGFGKSCNKGINEAKNEIVILLNNDIMVEEDSLRKLLCHMKRSGIFAVTPKLYAWDRKSFVSGAYVGEFKDGYIHIWNERDISVSPQVNNSSSTIFAVGCAMCFRKSDFLSLGGFDKIYEPYCWEDIDISYRALKRGLRIIYEPNSLMFHKVHGTIGSFKRAIEIKNELLFTWKNITDLDKIIQHFLLFPLRFFLRDNERLPMLKGYTMALVRLGTALIHRFKERIYFVYSDKEILRDSQHSYGYIKNRDCIGRTKPKLIFITPFLPYPLKSGGQIKTYNSLKELSRNYDVILISFIEDKNQEKDIPELKKLCVEVFTVLRHPGWHHLLEKISFPVFIKYFYSKDMESLIRKCIAGNYIDLVQIEYVNMAYYAKVIKGIPKILVEHDASIYTFNRSYEKPIFNKVFQFFDWLNWLRFQKYIYPYFNKIIVFTEEDCKIIKRAVSPKKIAVVPIGIEIDSYKLQPSSDRDIDIIFVGHMLHYPNIRGLFDFYKNVFPLIKKYNPKVNFYVIGSGIHKINLGEMVKDKNVHVVGEADDIKLYLARSKVLIAPIRLGAGLKVKILEGMAMGAAVVAWPNAVVGFKGLPEKDFYVAANNGDFAEKILDLLSNSHKRLDIAANARNIVEKYYNNRGVYFQMDAIYKSLIGYNDRMEEGTGYAKAGHENNGRKIIAGWDILLRCNYRCPYCFNHGRWDALERHNKPYTNKDWLGFWQRIYQRYGEVNIVIAGGEPFIYHGFIDLIKEMLPMHQIEVCSNLSTDVTRIIKEFSPGRLKLHPSFHPHQADLEQYIDKIKLLREAGWDLGPVIVAYPPILDKLEYFKQRFLEINTGIFVQPFIGRYNDKEYPRDYTNDEKRFLCSFNNIDSIKYQLNNVNTSGKLCNTGFKYFRVHPDGLIFRCAGAKESMGCIEDINFSLLEQAANCDVDFCMCNNESCYIVNEI